MNISLRRQRTLAESAKVTGFGFWSGADVTVEFRPAAAGSGVTFIRGDLPQPGRIPVDVNHRIEIPRRTSLAVGGARVEMIEHIMAALAGLRIDNCEVWVDQPEMPGCDGSSQAFVEAIQKAGAVEQDALRPAMVVHEFTRVGDTDSWVQAEPPSHPGMQFCVRIDYAENREIGRQTVELDITPGTFTQELSTARTFLLKHEADWLLSQGLGTRVSPQDVIVFDDNGPIDNELRFEDECVRHKALDLVGDLALSGCDLHGKFTAFCSGHRLNAELVKALLAEGQMLETAEVRRSA